MARRSFNPQFKINLVKLFNRAYSNEPRELRDKLRSTLSRSTFRQQFAKTVIDRIVERTSQENVDKKGKKLAAYSKSYINSDTFKIYGKSPADVNLEMSGEMLSSMKSIDTAQTIVFEFIGDNNKAKAHGHINGIRRSKGGKVVRDFFGLPEEDLDVIMIEAVEAFRSEAYDEISGAFEGQDFARQFGRVGSQPEFSTGVSMQDVLAQLMRNLNGES
jgi:hypothetical protein